MPQKTNTNLSGEPERYTLPLGDVDLGLPLTRQDGHDPVLIVPSEFGTTFVRNGTRPMDRLLGPRDLRERTTLSIEKIDNLISNGLFPSGSPYECRRRQWSERVLDSWIFSCMELRGSMVSLQDVPVFPSWSADSERDDLPYVGLRLLTRWQVLHLLGIEKSELYRRIKVSESDRYKARRPRVEWTDVPAPVPLTLKRRAWVAHEIQLLVRATREAARASSTTGRSLSSDGSS